MSEEPQPIIVRKVKKGGHGHHGGAWKVAYADFVTAMMAFFLLLWLLNAVTEEQLEGISNYFAPIGTRSRTGGDSLMEGNTMTPKGTYPIERPEPGETVDMTPPRFGQDEVEPGDVSEEALEELLKEREEEQFEEAESRLRAAIAGSPKLKTLAKSLLIDKTPEGLRIQIVDQKGLPMFPLGSEDMYLHTRKLMELVADVIQQMPQSVAISGHTDAKKYVSEGGYSNWELSADRANAARRALISYGVPEGRIARVVGKAATDPLLEDDPEAPANRRLSVVLLRGTGDQPPLSESPLPGGT